VVTAALSAAAGDEPPSPWRRRPAGGIIQDGGIRTRITTEADDTIPSGTG
jgi:hypothetical protein